MRRWLVNSLNGIWLGLVLIGVPSLVSRRFGPWQIASARDWQQLTLWGLGIGMVANLLGAWLFCRTKSARRLGLSWSGAFAALLVIEALLFG